jgi:amino-acid N-acetyltransferase
VLLTLRAANPDDWTAVRTHLERARLPLHGAHDHLERFTLAFDCEQLLGTAGLEVYGNTALLRSVAVNEEARGTGIGAKLVRHSLELARGLGVADVVLLTETAADYFPRFGFRIIARADAPDAVNASLEFRGACPDSATTMLLQLEGSQVVVG